MLEPGVFGYIAGDETQWEKEPLEQLAKDGQLMAHRHRGFWQCMDTLRDKRLLQDLWDEGQAPWPRLPPVNCLPGYDPGDATVPTARVPRRRTHRGTPTAPKARRTSTT